MVKDYGTTVFQTILEITQVYRTKGLYIMYDKSKHCKDPHPCRGYLSQPVVVVVVGVTILESSTV